MKPIQSSIEENIQENESQCSSTNDNAEHVQVPTISLFSIETNVLEEMIINDNDSDKDSIDQLCIDKGKKCLIMFK